VRERGAEGDIWAYEGVNGRVLEEIVLWGASWFVLLTLGDTSSNCCGLGMK